MVDGYYCSWKFLFGGTHPHVFPQNLAGKYYLFALGTGTVYIILYLTVASNLYYVGGIQLIQWYVSTGLGFACCPRMLVMWSTIL